MNKELKKARAKYNKAQGELIKIRDEVFPVGCIVTDGNFINGVVQGGSYYADQVRVSNMHVSLSCLKRVEGDGDVT